jgi:hypothetical protein
MNISKNPIFYLDEKEWKSFLITENAILLSSKKYTDATEMIEAADKKSMLSLTKTKEIELNTLEKLTHLDNSDSLTIHHGGKSLSLDFGDAQNVKNVAATLSEIRNFNVSQGSQTTFSAMTPSLIGLGVTAVLTWLIHSMAAEIAMGQDVDVSGRKSLYKRIFAWLAETLGTTGTLAVGGLIALTCLYFMYQAYKNPSDEYVYS